MAPTGEAKFFPPFFRGGKGGRKKQLRILFSIHINCRIPSLSLYNGLCGAFPYCDKQIKSIISWPHLTQVESASEEHGSVRRVAGSVTEGSGR